MDIILYNIGSAILLTLFGFLVGSIPNAIWIGKLFFHKDPRDYGSGNAGGTNAGRVFGKGIGVLVIFLDAIKVILPMYIAYYILTNTPIYHGTPLMSDIYSIYSGTSNSVIQWPVYWLTAIGCSFGHCYPIFAKFRGGKNVSTFFGIVLGVSWFFGLAYAICFFIVLKWKKYVSLASVLSAWVSVVLTWIWAILLMTKIITGSWMYFVNYYPMFDCQYGFAIMVTVGAALLTFKHRTNFQRLKNGSESKIKWMK